MRDNKIDPKHGKKLKFGKYTSQETLLVKRCREAGIDIPTYQPIGNLCLVWRFPPITMSKGGIILPDESPTSRGILVAAGPTALDYLESHGISLGHVVVFARFAGEEANDQGRDVELKQRFITLNSRDIQGSEDLRRGLEKGTYRYKIEDGKRKLERPKALAPVEDKKAKVLRLASDPGATDAERAAATKIAAKLK
jgi:co-chaperonin GroES (HSP10)